jgi:integrase
MTWSSTLAKWRSEKPSRIKEGPPRRVELWDSILPGFGLRVSDGGKIAWQVLYRVDGKMVRETLGSIAQIPNVGDARALARESMERARAGTNPVEEKRVAIAERKRQAEAEEERKRNTVAAIVTRYLAERSKVNQKGKPLAPEYLAELKRALERDVVKSPIGMVPIDDVDGKAIRKLLREMAKTRPGQARHVYAYLSTFFQWATDEDIIDKNPVTGVKAPAPKVERDRALEDWEIGLFWKTCDKIGWPFGPLFQLLLLLGPRRDELACSTRSQFDLSKQTWTLRGRDTKNEEALITHLPLLAVEIIERLPRIKSARGYLFTTNGEQPISGFGHAAERGEKIMREVAEAEGLPEIEHFTRHDLRRSLATGMAKLGVAPHIADKVLNHTGGSTITGVTKVYNRFQYLPERKAALDLWAAHIEKLIGLVRPQPEDSNVVDLATARVSA